MTNTVTKKILLTAFLSLTVVTLPSFGVETEEGYVKISTFGTSDRSSLQESFQKFDTISAQFIKDYTTQNPTSAIDVLHNVEGTLFDEIMDDADRFKQLGFLSGLPYAMEDKKAIKDPKLEENYKTLQANYNMLKQYCNKFKTVQDAISQVQVTNDKSVEQGLNELTKFLSDILLNPAVEFFTWNNGIFALSKENINLLTCGGYLPFFLKEHFDSVSTKFKNYEQKKTLNNASPLIAALDVMMTDLDAEFNAQVLNYKYMPTQQGILNTNNLTREKGFKVLRTLVRNADEASTSILLREHNGKKEIYFLTAGTKSLTDVLVDGDALETNGQDGFGDGDAAHAGFIKAVFQDPNFVKFSRYLVETHKDATFYTAGHSLGAAMSVIIGKTLWEISGQKIQPRILGIATPMPYKHKGFQNAVRDFLNSNPLQNITCIYSTYDGVPGSTQPLGFNNLGINVHLPTQFSGTLLQGEIPVVAHHFLDSGYLKQFEQLHNVIFSGLSIYYKKFRHVGYALKTVNELESSFTKNKKELESLQRFIKEGQETTLLQYNDDNGQTYSFSIPSFVTHYADDLGRDPQKINKRINDLRERIESYNNALKFLEEQGPGVLSELEKINSAFKDYYNREDTQGNYLAKLYGFFRSLC